MKILILSLLVLGTFITSNAQTIERTKAFGGYKYSQNGQVLTMKTLVQAMESNEEAYTLIKQAKSSNALASVLGVVGGALIGYPLGTAIGGGDPNWTLLGVGAGIVLITIPITSGINKKAKKAIDIYNSSLGIMIPTEYKSQLSITGNENGLGLALNF